MSGILTVNGKDISREVADSKAHIESRKHITKVVFLLNITKVGNRACDMCINLLIVKLPDGIEEIREGAFYSCERLVKIFFPSSLKLIGESAFEDCLSLEEADLQHTVLEELGRCAFYNCAKLKTMKIPGTLKKYGSSVFQNCRRLMPALARSLVSTSKVAEYLRRPSAKKQITDDQMTDEERELFLEMITNAKAVVLAKVPLLYREVTGRNLTKGGTKSLLENYLRLGEIPGWKKFSTHNDNNFDRWVLDFFPSSSNSVSTPSTLFFNGRKADADGVLNEENLLAHFASFSIESVQLIENTKKRDYDYGFLNFSTAADATRCLEENEGGILIEGQTKIELKPGFKNPNNPQFREKKQKSKDTTVYKT
ncbi:hypothetical protein TrST_g4414 [Triparma strigata]|uniref:RRM domain-containing protein n=1 Tax=Triparma strigata TaxID=1606541 RepID=A0A9W7AA05_9STRA|nr:hypothetical protein TrST_g4414 [Triparma strigata]